MKLYTDSGCATDSREVHIFDIPATTLILILKKEKLDAEQSWGEICNFQWKYFFF